MSEIPKNIDNNNKYKIAGLIVTALVMLSVVVPNVNNINESAGKKLGEIQGNLTSQGEKKTRTGTVDADGDAAFEDRSREVFIKNLFPDLDLNEPSGKYKVEVNQKDEVVAVSVTENGIRTLHTFTEDSKGNVIHESKETGSTSNGIQELN